MKTAGIIVEYNPFHNGHEYHIAQTRRLSGADFVIAVMSGDFVQRGEPALLDKYVRTKMALSCGADLVLELPVFFSTGSAGDFAAGAVSLLDKLGCVDSLCFGSECNDGAILRRAACVLCNEPPLFSDTLQSELKKGLSFARARNLALHACLDLPDKDNALFSSPNDILGLEYCAALLRRKSSVRPVVIKRQGAGYHESSLPPRPSDSFPSALAIRQALVNSRHAHGLHSFQAANDSSPAAFVPMESGDFYAGLRGLVPVKLLPYWEEILKTQNFLTAEDLTKELRYCLIARFHDGYEGYADVNRELSGKLKKAGMEFAGWNDLCIQLKSRELTYSRISRALCHILLSISCQDMQAARANDYVPYARILGFRKEAAPLLSSLKKNSNIPLITKLPDALRSLPANASAMLQKDIEAAHLYESAMAAKQKRLPVNEFIRQLCIVD